MGFQGFLLPFTRALEPCQPLVQTAGHVGPRDPSIWWEIEGSCFLPHGNNFMDATFTSGLTASQRAARMMDMVCKLIPGGSVAAHWARAAVAVDIHAGLDPYASLVRMGVLT